MIKTSLTGRLASVVEAHSTRAAMADSSGAQLTSGEVFGRAMRLASFAATDAMRDDERQKTNCEPAPDSNACILFSSGSTGILEALPDGKVDLKRALKVADLTAGSATQCPA